MESNRRVLIVDDQADLREQVVRLLRQSGTATETQSLIDQIRQRISRPASAEGGDNRPRYQVDAVSQGRDAYERVKSAWAANKPYACIFLDMRMPPGWDGLETAQRIRSVDKELQIVIMTAYSDHDQREIAEKLGDPDKLIYLKKPFHPEELRQLALAMTEKWNMNRRESERMLLTNRLMRENAQLRRRCRRPRAEGRAAIVHAFAGLTDASAVALAERQGENKFDVLATTSPEDEEVLRKSLKKLAPGVGQFAASNKDQTGFVPLNAEGFRGGVVMTGVDSVLDFQELTPFLEILAETAAEVTTTAVDSDALPMRISSKRLRNALSCSRQRSVDLATEIRDAAAHIADNENVPHDDDIRRITTLVGELSNAFDDYLNLFSDAIPEASESLSVADLFTHGKAEVADRCSERSIETVWTEEPSGVKLQHGPRMELILHHLLENALSAMARGKARGVKSHKLEVSVDKGDEGVRLRVADTGIGMDPDARAKYGAADVVPREGRGLGARLVVVVAERLGGTVQVSGGASGGTTVTVSLPASVVAGEGA
jgi:CheY-like chemotaxis protein